MTITCPCCGEKIQLPSKKVKREHKRLPNGFGQITELHDTALRNRFRVMISIGKTPEGKPISKLLKPQAYFKTYNEAYEALLNYHKDPSSAKISTITVKELIDEWLVAKEQEKIAYNTLRNYKSICNRLESIYGISFKDLNKSTIKETIAGMDRPSTRHFARVVFTQLYRYAMENDYISVNIMDTIGQDKATSAAMKENYKGHKGFTFEEVETLWQHLDIPFVNIILIQCYTGFRPAEMCKIFTEDLNMADMTINGGSKTDAGKDRIVPVCEKILELVKTAYNTAKAKGYKRLFNISTYTTYMEHFRTALNDVGLNGSAHAAHDPRVFFITNCKECGVDEYAIKRLVGHAIKDLTERVYTKRTIDWLRDEINKLK